MIVKEQEFSGRPFWVLLKIKPNDDMLIFLFAKDRKSSLIQSICSRIKIFLWDIFTLCFIKYAILDQF